MHVKSRSLRDSQGTDSHYNHQKPVFQDTNTVSDSLDGMWQSLHETFTEATVPGEISLFLMESGKPS